MADRTVESHEASASSIQALVRATAHIDFAQYVPGLLDAIERVTTMDSADPGYRAAVQQMDKRDREAGNGWPVSVTGGGLELLAEELLADGFYR
jgi:hypothetical protein